MKRAAFIIAMLLLEFVVVQPEFGTKIQDLTPEPEVGEPISSLFPEPPIREVTEESSQAYCRLGESYVGGSLIPGFLTPTDKAIRAFEKAIRLRPDSARAYNGLGYAYHGVWLGQWIYGSNYSEAIRAHTKALQLEPNYPEAYVGLAVAYDGRREYQRAVDALDHAIALDRDYADAHRLLSAVWEHLGQYNRASAQMLECIRCSHRSFSDEEWRSFIFSLERCAVGHANRTPADWCFDYNWLGRLYAKAGDLQAAIEAQQQAIVFDPDEPMLYFGLGQTYLAVGDDQAALAQYQVLIGLAERTERLQDKNARQYADELIAGIKGRSRTIGLGSGL
jgi:tetratricopeptide (TPR) repeat protein